MGLRATGKGHTSLLCALQETAVTEGEDEEEEEKEIGSSPDVDTVVIFINRPISGKPCTQRGR